MRRNDRIAAWTLAALVVAAGIFALAAEGDQNDPLLTIGYLNQWVLPETDAKVDAAVAAVQESLEQQFAADIDGITAQMEDKLANLDGGASFLTVALTDGQTITAKEGTEIVLRSGSAKAAGSLLDVTSGGTVASGKSLTEHHLYLVQTAGAALTASGEVSVMVRGSYTVE